MQRWIRVSVLSLSTIALLASGGYADRRDDLRDFMQVKLKHSQSVLEGLVLEDFDKIAKNAQEMSLLSLAETWQVLQTPEYIDYSRKFRNATDTLSDMAKKKNLTEATKAFNLMTTRCVECHKYVRGVRMVKSK
jgi:cytochrome c556